MIAFATLALLDLEGAMPAGMLDGITTWPGPVWLEGWASPDARVACPDVVLVVNIDGAPWDLKSALGEGPDGATYERTKADLACRGWRLESINHYTVGLFAIAGGA